MHERASFLRDAIFAASDGIVTTFAVVAGSAGAAFDPTVALILGFANLFADGFSMASGTYLGVKSKMEYEKAEGDKHEDEPSPLMQGFVTFLSFNIAGFVPLMPYVFNFPNKFESSLVLVFALLFAIGMVRSRFTRKGLVRSGIEMLFIGGFAAVVAYFTGELIEKLVMQ